MKILVSSIGKDEKSIMDRRFGRCKYFVIFDSESNKYNFIENDGSKAGGGAGIAAANQVIELGIKTIITGNLGPNAYELILKDGIKAYTSEEVSVEECIKNYFDNSLKEISIPGISHQGM